MFIRPKKLMFDGAILVAFLLIVACGAGGGKTGTGTGSQASQSPGTVPTTTIPKQKTPTGGNGTQSTGPAVISIPTPVPGDKPGSQQVVLPDRILIINRVSKQQGPSAGTTLINLELTIKNTSAKAIKNDASFFLLMGAEGDIFGTQYNSSDNFYGPIAARTGRSGTIVFEVPSAAVTSLSLLYRPEIAKETVIVLLKFS
jgi:hypothetical protein